MEGQTSVVIPMVITTFPGTHGTHSHRQTDRRLMPYGRANRPDPLTASGISAATVTSDPDGDGHFRAQHHPVPLDVPDVALRRQRLLAYRGRLHREEAEIIQEPGRARPPMERQAPEVRVKRPCTPLLVDRLADAGELIQPRQQRAEPGMYREPRGAPEISQ